MPALSVIRYCLTDDAGRFHAPNGVLMLCDTAYRARTSPGPGLHVAPVRVTTAEDDRAPVWYVTVRRKWLGLGPVELVEMLGMSQAWATRADAADAARAAGGKVQAVRIVAEG